MTAGTHICVWYIRLMVQWEVLTVVPPRGRVGVCGSGGASQAPRPSAVSVVTPRHYAIGSARR